MTVNLETACSGAFWCILKVHNALESLLLSQPGTSSGVLTDNYASASARLSGSTRLNPSVVIRRNCGSLSTSCSAVDAPQLAHL